jgi:hypothetical protein
MPKTLPDADPARRVPNSAQTAQPVLDDDTLYMGDNGRVTCGRHAGCSARYSGRDISGQRVDKIGPAEIAYAQREMDYTPACEVCR